MAEEISALLNSQKNKILLAIYPHPDDETFFCGGLLLAAKKMGFKTYLCTLTQGGAGQMHIHPHGRTIKQIRKNELEKAAKALKVDRLLIEDFEDGKLNMQKAMWIAYIDHLMQKVKPSIVVTYDHSGITGHPDHIVLSIELLHLIKKKYPKVTLLWSALPKNISVSLFNNKVGRYSSECTYALSLRSYWLAKFRAACMYKSQRFGPVFLNPRLTIVLMFMKLKTEWYHKVNLRKAYAYKFVKFDI